MAGIILHGKIKSQGGKYDRYSNTSRNEKSCKQFPVKSYKFYPVKVYDLKYNDQIPKKDRIKKLYKFIIIPDAILKLISFDKDSGISKFKLTLKGGDWLSYTGSNYLSDGAALFETGGMTLKGNGSLKLADGTLAEFIIEGKFEVIDGKPFWTSFNRNQYFDIEIKKVALDPYYHCDNEVSLVRLQDIPVIVSN